MKYASLVCSSHVRMAIRCLTSFVKAGGVKEMFVFGDGSLSKKDINLINKVPCNINLVRRIDCQNNVPKKIHNYKNALEYREEHAFGIKLVDIPVYLNEDFVYVDTDIMFCRKFNLKNIRRSKIVFMYEDVTSYSVDYFDQFLFSPIGLVKNLNAGFLYVSKDAYKIEKVDAFLGNERYKNRDWLIEQTAWAHLAASCTSSYWSPSQVAIANERGEYSDNVIAVHYISTYRHRLEKDHLTLEDKTPDPPSVIRLFPSKQSRFTDGLISRAMARFS